MARARSVLERDPDRVTRCPPCHLVEGGHDPCQARGDAGPQMRPGVNDDAGEIQPLRALELVGEGVHGPAPGGVILRAEIDQVARVGEDVADARLPARRVKGADLRVRQRRGVPLALVPQEELHGAAVERPSALEGAGDAARDIPWSTPPPSDGRAIADELIDIYGSALWDRLPEAERVQLNRRIAAWRLSALMHGEQGALLATSQLVDIVKGADAKFFQATQVMDEARHNEVLDRYITERLDNRKYPIPANARDVFDSILGESRWYVKTIGLQLVAETFAVALFKMMAESARDPVLEAVCRRILQDESRHMGFGMLALPEVVHGASPGERRELEDYTCFAVEKTLTGFFPREAYEDAGFSRAEIEEAKRYRRDVAARNDYAPFRKLFKRDMHASMVANLARLGLLTERVRPKLAKLGVTLPAN